jgi:protein-L-isoaspartate(D-aspartate) O-methyltransferase
MKYIISIILSLALAFSSCAQTKEHGYFDQQRKQMVENQIMERGITSNKVINALRNVERHRFVPEEDMQKAYEDRPLPIGHGQTISQPYIVALMTDVLDLRKKDKVLEIGTGSGYQAAVLAEVVEQVYTIEIVEPLGKQAKKLLQELGYDNINVKIGNGYKGWPEQAPFDAIIVTAAPTKIPEPLKNQLAEGGKMIIPVGERFAQELVLLQKINGELKKKSIIPVRFVPMVDDNGKLY